MLARHDVAWLAWRRRCHRRSRRRYGLQAWRHSARCRHAPDGRRPSRIAHHRHHRRLSRVPRTFRRLAFIEPRGSQGGRNGGQRAEEPGIPDARYLAHSLRAQRPGRFRLAGHGHDGARRCSRQGVKSVFEIVLPALRPPRDLTHFSFRSADISAIEECLGDVPRQVSAP